MSALFGKRLDRFSFRPRDKGPEDMDFSQMTNEELAAMVNQLSEDQKRILRGLLEAEENPNSVENGA